MSNTGQMGEQAALEYFLAHGYKLIERNYRSRYGEIDLIVATADTIVFAEVKARAKNALVSGWEAITPAKQQRILKTALVYLSEHSEARQVRFDAVSVVVRGGAVISIEHLENVMEAGGV